MHVLVLVKENIQEFAFSKQSKKISNDLPRIGVFPCVSLYKTYQEQLNAPVRLKSYTQEYAVQGQVYVLPRPGVCGPYTFER